MLEKVVALAVLAPLAITPTARRAVVACAALTTASRSVIAFGPRQGAPVRYAVAPTGNEANYRVQERITTVDIPNYQAVGRTQQVSGAIVFDAKGAIVPGASRIVIDVRGLKSDQERRDGFVQRRLLETATYPTVQFAPTAIRGLDGPFPTTGTKTFQLVGDLTVKGVTKVTTWDVTARFDGGTVTGDAATQITFAEFGIEKPSIPVILSLADEMKLEYHFTLTRAS